MRPQNLLPAPARLAEGGSKNTTAGLSSGRFTHKILFSRSPHGLPTTRREHSLNAISRQSPVLVTSPVGPRIVTQLIINKQFETHDSSDSALFFALLRRGKQNGRIFIRPSHTQDSFSHSPDGPPTTRCENNLEGVSCQSPVLGTGRQPRRNFATASVRVRTWSFS